ncbi:hypothetical protein L596_004629 [Steinernema carpocapsae]|uniref:CCR4-NOT transcription complex subunit 4 n=1 Tax=Steinernema carpocapsae TaxID=34508 RepID=A0A4U8UWE3_STECR|nr:hypothetical protein L596_004629 [Steinernema carpocapsae]
MSSDDQSDRQCPLCMEALELDDLNFFPCKCEYQICWFCWHRIRTDENGLCPACRQPYTEEPEFQAPSSEDVMKNKEKRLKTQQGKNKKMSAEAKKHLAAYRVLQKNLLYVVGLPTRCAEMDMRKSDFFQRFGKVVKSATSVSGTGTLNACSAYITYNKDEEALRAIQAVNNSVMEGRQLKASLGTTKYCSSFLRNSNCQKPDCMYLHEIADLEVSFTKEDMHAGKHAEYERKLLEEFSKSSAQQGTTVSVGSSFERKDITAFSNAHFPTIAEIKKQQQQTSTSSPTPPKALSLEREEMSTEENAEQEQNGVQSEQDQEVAEILKEPLPSSNGTPSSQNSISPSELENETNGFSIVRPETPTAFDDKEEQELPEDESTNVTEEMRDEPLQSEEDIGIQLAKTISDILQPPQFIESAPTADEVRQACRSPPGFSRRTTPSVHSEISSKEENVKFPVNLPPPPGLLPPTLGLQPSNAGSSILGMLQKRTEPVPPPQTAPSSNWHSMFGFASNLGQDQRKQRVANDDDLGFDPFHESTKGLAALVALETGKEMKQNDSAALERHHQRPLQQSQPQAQPQSQQKPVGVPPGFGASSNANSKWGFGDQDSLYHSAPRHSQQLRPQFPENLGLLADIFNSVGTNQHGKNSQTIGDRLRQHNHGSLFENAGSRYRSHQPGYPENRPEVGPSNRHHMMYGENFNENRARGDHMNFYNEDRHRNMTNFHDFNQPRQHQRGVAPPPGFDSSRHQQPCWPGNHAPSNLSRFNDLLGHGDRSSSGFDRPDFTKTAESQAGLRALLPNVNVRFLETSDDAPSLGHYHNIFDRPERPHQASSMHPFSHSNTQTQQSNHNAYGRASPKLGTNANQYFNTGQNASNQWLPPPPGFQPISRH